MDVITAFAIVVVVLSWICYLRTPEEEALVRLFFGILTGLGAAVGVLGLVLRQTNSILAG